MRTFLVKIVTLLLLGAVGPVWAQPLPVRVDSVLIPRKNRFLIFPLVTKSPETNWAFGFASAFIFNVSRRDTLTRTSTIPFGALYTLNKQLIVGSAGTIFFPGETYVLRLRTSFTSFPDQFWGIGNDSREADREQYEFQQFSANAVLLRKVHGKFFLGLAYDYQTVFDFRYQPGQLFDQQDVLGRYGGHVSGVGGVVSRDSRNHAYSPDRGSLFQLTYTNFNRLIGSQFNYQVYELDVRKFIRTAPGHVLAVQAFGTFTHGQVPIRNLAVLGSPVIMRGYYAGRYKDKHYLATQLEYRMPVWWRFGLVGFAGVGQVSPRLADLRPGRFKYSLGGGVRFALLEKEKLNLRLDYGFGNDSRSLYIVVSESF
ncbi:MAG: BamA/TamA family outer membrane protein [Ferruginibacter sp.]|nr:BamA/TamA family outer membrane protein [Cytophagales bacterium]